MLPRSSVVSVGKIDRFSLVNEVRLGVAPTWQDNARGADEARYYANMNCAHYPAERLIELFRRQTVATFPELAAALETSADRNVFRKLAELDYRTSYSHRGAYYTLDSLARYDAYGLWSHDDVHFSKHGTLLDTAGELVIRAPAGYFTDELEAVVHVPVKDALRHLVERGRLQLRPCPERFLWVLRNADFGRNSGQPSRPKATNAGDRRAVLQLAQRATTPALRRTGKPAAGPWRGPTNGRAAGTGRGDCRTGPPGAARW